MLSSYYEQDGITIYHGDCRDVVPLLSDVDAVVTDPPWNLGYFKDDKKDWPAYAEMVKAIKDECEAKAAGQCWFVCMKSLPFIARYFEGYTPFASCKNFSQMGRGVLPQCWDIAFVKGAYNGGGRNWFVCNTAGMLNERTIHPTPRTLDVMRYICGMFEWPVICDPFMGSGTTLLAAKLEGRKAIGIEIEEKYCEAAANRLRQGVLPFAG